MGRSVQALDDMVRRRMGEAIRDLPTDPIMQSVKSPPNSAFYHLYANVTLAVIKKLLCSPVALDPAGDRDTL